MTVEAASTSPIERDGDGTRARARVRRSARPPALARTGGRGDDRERHRRGSSGGLLRDPRDAEHRSGRRLRRGSRLARRDGSPRGARAPGFMAAISKRLGGEEMTEMADLADAGLRPSPRRPAGHLGRPDAARAAVRGGHRPASSRCTARSRPSRATAVHEGAVCRRARLAATPRWRRRDGRSRPLNRRVRGRPLHMIHLSARESVEALRRAGSRRPRVRGGLAPSPRAHRRGRALARPEREDEPAAAGGRDGARWSRAPRRYDRADRHDHAPHSREEKERRSKRRRSVSRASRPRSPRSSTRRAGRAPPRDAARADVRRPCPRARPPRAQVEVGARANLVLLDLEEEWTVQRAGFRSRSANSWRFGSTLYGGVLKTRWPMAAWCTDDRFPGARGRDDLPRRVRRRGGESRSAKRFSRPP